MKKKKSPEQQFYEKLIEFYSDVDLIDAQIPFSETPPNWWSYLSDTQRFVGSLIASLRDAGKIGDSDE